MSANDDVPKIETSERFQSEVTKKEDRKIRKRGQKKHSLWYGLGTFGLVGWSVAISTVLGTILGSWLDSTWPVTHSWTITGLVAGTILGCVHAWLWIRREDRRNSSGKEL